MGRGVPGQPGFRVPVAPEMHMTEDAWQKISLTRRQRTLIMIPLLLGGFIALINETLLSVAFPQMAVSLQIPMGTIQWLATAYMLVIGISVPVVAFLMESFTTKRLYLMAMLLFTASTLCCGLSRSFPVLLVFRILQGIGTGMMVPIMTHVILAIFPIERRGAVMGLSLIVILSAPALAPTVSGIILAWRSWHWLFFSMLPLAIVATISGAITLKNVSSLTRPKIDLFSVLLSTIGFGGLIYGMGAIESMGASHWAVRSTLLAGIMGLALFTLRQLKLEQPLLELRSFRYPMFSLGAAIMVITFMIPFSTIIILPIYMQNVLGITPFAAGLALMPAGIANGFFAFLAGNLYDRTGARGLATAGFAILAVGMFFLSRISESTQLANIIVLHVIVLTGISFITSPVQTNALNQLPTAYHTHGVAITNSIIQIASAFGASIFIGIMTARESRILERIAHPDMLEQQWALMNGVALAFRVSMFLALVGLVLSLFIRRRSASPELRSSS